LDSAAALVPLVAPLMRNSVVSAIEARRAALAED